MADRSDEACKRFLVNWALRNVELIGSTWGYTTDMTVSGPAAVVGALADTASKNVTMLGSAGRLAFTRTTDGLTITLPRPDRPLLHAYVLKIGGLKMNPSTATESGNPR